MMSEKATMDSIFERLERLAASSSSSSDSDDDDEENNHIDTGDLIKRPFPMIPKQQHGSSILESSRTLTEQQQNDDLPHEISQTTSTSTKSFLRGKSMRPPRLDQTADELSSASCSTGITTFLKRRPNPLRNPCSLPAAGTTNKENQQPAEYLYRTPRQAQPTDRKEESGYHTRPPSSSRANAIERPQIPVLSQYSSTKSNPTTTSSGMQRSVSLATVPAPAATSNNEIKRLTINDKEYMILKQVGKGGSSMVYKVFDQESEDTKAIKVVDLSGAEEDIAESFRNEINLLRELQLKCSERIIRVDDFAEVQDRNSHFLYVVMELGDTDLAAFFKSRRKDGAVKEADYKLIDFYWREMLLAVQVVHEAGIVHADLKPQNFILVGGNLKIIDFGIANKVPGNKTAVTRHATLGTMNYISPEAFEDLDDEAEDSHAYKARVGVKADVWGLGCILYGMVYGRTPFQHITSQFHKMKYITDPSKPIAFKECSNPLLLEVMQMCLQRDPKLRPSIRELLEHPYVTGVMRS